MGRDRGAPFHPQADLTGRTERRHEDFASPPLIVAQDLHMISRPQGRHDATTPELLSACSRNRSSLD